MGPVNRPDTENPRRPALATEVLSAYLARIGVSEPPTAPTWEALATLQRAHLTHVPFENLDIGLGRPIRLDHESVVRKVVSERRGGYCFELNGLFATLLTTMGYAAELLSARVSRAGGGLSEEFDHLALLVRSPHLSKPHLVDVGFGDAFLDPLPLEDGFRRPEGDKAVGLARTETDTWAYREDHGPGWEIQYLFSTRPRRLADFEDRNRWQQTSPESRFTRSRVASRVAGAGRVTLTISAGRPRLITTERGARSERNLAVGEVAGVLDRDFGISLDEAAVRRLAALP